MDKDPSTIRAEIDQTRERLGDTVEALSYKTDVKARAKDAVTDRKDAVVGKIAGFKDAVVGTASDATDAVATQKDQLSAKVSSATPSGQDVKRTTRRVASVAQQNPLGLAVGATALGFLAGLLLPSSRLEDRKLGEVADQVKDTLKDSGGQVIEHGKQVAQDVAQSATETAQQSGQQHAQQLQEEVGANAQQTAGSVSSSS
ncbi:MAG: DUF3618 domain-containing protein [Candidatus Dormibacteria bacterium]